MTGRTSPKKFGEHEANRLVKILQQIAESLDREHIVDVKRILTEIVKTSKREDSANFDENIKQFVEIVIFKAGISVNLFKQAVRGFLMIKRQPEFGDLVSQHVSQLLAKEFPSLARMGDIDDETFRIYIKALSEGEEKVKHVRLMIVGMFGVGKTCIARRLCNMGIDDVKSTVGIDVSINACEVDKSGKWFVRDEKSRDDRGFDKRVNKVMKKATNVNKGPVVVKPVVEPTPLPKAPAPQAPISTTISVEEEDTAYQEARENFQNFKEEEKPGISVYRENVKNFSQDVVIEKPEQPKQIPNMDRNTTVSIWDFAGQSVYYSTHHFFLSSRSIYLLVMDISKGLDEKVPEGTGDGADILLKGCMPEGFKCGDALRFWINSIYTYARDSHSYRDVKNNKEIKYTPTIVLIGTHKDKVPGTTEKEKEIYKEKYFREALKPLKDNPARELIHPKTFLVDCTEDNSEVLVKIKESIIEVAKKQAFWKEAIPAKWIPLERTIEEEKKKESYCMDFDDLEEKNKETEFSLESPQQMKLFLQFQHFFGNLIYYNVKGLDQKIILRPQWILDMFKLFVTHQPISDQAMEDMWSEYENKAILKPALFRRLIGQSEHVAGERQIKEIADLVDHMMKHLDVIATPLKLQEEGEGQKAEDKNPLVVPEQKLKEEDFVIVPCMLKKLVSGGEEMQKVKSYFMPDIENAKATSVLGLVFENRFLPPAIFHRLLATCIRKWEILKHDGDYLLYNGMGVFKLDNERNITLWYAEYVIFLRIIADKDHDASKCVEVKDEITKMLRQILFLDKQKRSLIDAAIQQTEVEPFKEYILCDKALDKSIEVMFRPKGSCLSGLLDVEKYHCNETLHCDCGANHHIKRPDALSYWYPKYLIEAVTKYFEGVQQEGRSLSEQPEEVDLANVSKLIGKEYTELGRALGLSREDLDRIEADNPTRMASRIVNVLGKWLKESHEPTFEVLRQKIKEVKLKQKK